MEIKHVDIGIAEYEGGQLPGFFATVVGTGLTGVRAVVHLPNGDYRTLSFQDETLLSFYDNSDLESYPPGEYRVVASKGDQRSEFSAYLGSSPNAPAIRARPAGDSGSGLAIRRELPTDASGRQDEEVKVFARPMSLEGEARLRNRPAAALTLTSGDREKVFPDLAPAIAYEVSSLTRTSHTNGIMTASRDRVQKPELVFRNLNVETVAQWPTGDDLYLAAGACCSTTSTCCCSTTSTSSVSSVASSLA